MISIFRLVSIFSHGRCRPHSQGLRWSPYLLLVALASLSVFATSTAAHASDAWPNEPAGSKVIYDCEFNDTICGLDSYYRTQAFATVEGRRVFDTFMAVGSLSANGQWGKSLPNVREFYFGTWWATNREFQGYSNNQGKMLFVRNPNIDNNFLVWQGAPDGPKTLKWYMQACWNGLNENFFVNPIPL